MEDACNGVFSQTFTPDVFNYSESILHVLHL